MKLELPHYTPFLYHSNYGIGGSTFKTLFEYLNRHRIKSCGIVDDTFFGLPEFIKYANDYNIKPIIGARVSLTPNQDMDNEKRNNTVRAKSRTQSDIYLFVKNKQGYENLCGILTAHAFENININFIKEHSVGLILLSNSTRLLKELSPVFDNKYYLLLPYHTALKQEFPCIAANEILYVTEKEKLLYKLMRKIKNCKYKFQRGSPHHLLTNEEFNKVFADYQQAMKNNKILAESCNFIPENRRWIFPRSKQNLYEIIEPITKKNRLSDIEKKRIQYEHKIIGDMGFEPYFCLVYHLKEFALSKGIGMNIRGSAASSFILYILGLSIVNPLKYNRQHSWALPMQSRLSDQDQRAVV